MTFTTTIDPRIQLDDISRALSELHRCLLAAVQISFEKVYGRVPNSGALLQLVVNDPLFAWLRPLSALIAEIDDLEEEQINAAKIANVRRTVADWIAGEASYNVMLQHDPSVVVAHAQLKRALTPRPR